MEFLLQNDKVTEFKEQKERKFKKKLSSNVNDSNFSTQNDLDLSDSSEEIIFEQSISFNDCGELSIENYDASSQTQGKSCEIRIIEFPDLEASTFSLNDSEIENHTVDLDFSFGRKNPQKILIKKKA